MADRIDKAMDKLSRRYQEEKEHEAFKALIIGDWGSGKTYLTKTARKPVLIDSFDQNGTVGLSAQIKSRQIIVDHRWERHNTTAEVFMEWYETLQERIHEKVFERLGTYVLDSITTWTMAVMDYLISDVTDKFKVRPKWEKEYMQQRVILENIMREVLALPCDIIAIGHVQERFLKIVDKHGGVEQVFDHYKFKATGQAVTTIPLMFSEVYFMKPELHESRKPDYWMITSRTHQIPAKSRLAGNGGIDHKEEPNIKAILKKAGFPFTDKPLFSKVEAEKITGGNEDTKDE